MPPCRPRLLQLLLPVGSQDQPLPRGSKYLSVISTVAIITTMLAFNSSISNIDIAILVMFIMIAITATNGKMDMVFEP